MTPLLRTLPRVALLAALLAATCTAAFAQVPILCPGGYMSWTGFCAAPTANDDSYTTDADTPLSVAAPGVLSNDTDPLGSPLTGGATLIQGPAHHLAFLLNNDGSFAYTPASGFVGSAYFTYRVGESATATVSITVQDPGDPPSPCIGDLSLTTQAEVAGFTCNEVGGNLVVQGGGITDVSTLSSLSSVAGNLTVETTALTSLSGLSSLASVGGNLVISGNASLTSLAGLSSLAGIGGGIVVHDNDAITSLSGLGGFATVAGDLLVYGNAQLTSLAALSGLTAVGGTLYITQSPALLTLEGLENVASVGGNLQIAFNPALASLAALENLTAVGGFVSITFNSALTSLEGLEGITATTDDFLLVGNAALSSLSSLENLTTIGGRLSISGSALTTLDGLDNLVSIGTGLSIQSNGSLTDCSCGLAGLITGDPAAFSGVGGLVLIFNNDPGGQCTSREVVLATPCATDPPPVTLGSQEDVDAFSATEVEGDLVIDGSGITDLSALATLTTVEGGVTITNTSVTSLTGLENLASVGGAIRKEAGGSGAGASVLGDGLTIVGNPDLASCACGLAGLVAGGAFVGVAGAVDIADNAPGGLCTSPEVVLANPCVTNRPPEVTEVTVPAIPVSVGSTVAVTAAFTDEDAGDVHTCTIAYGDGAPAQEGTVSGLTCSGAHAYAAAGVYAVTVVVTDAAGASGAMTTTDYIAVYDPSAGFVTGAGRIDSPAGAYVSNPDLTGPAHFALQSRYQNGASVPSGHTAFRFRAADLDFRATSFEWLVIAGARAQYKGLGQINDSGNYGFLLTAIDGAVNGGGGADRFRIKIWDRAAGGAVVYDNQLSAGCADQTDGATPCTTLTTGNVIIQRSAGNGGSAKVIPEAFVLEPPRPNPARPATMLRFGLPEAARVELVVFDALGRAVAHLFEGELEAGWHDASFDGVALPSGTYFARLTTAGEHPQTQRVTLVR